MAESREFGKHVGVVSVMAWRRMTKHRSAVVQKVHVKYTKLPHLETKILICKRYKNYCIK